MSEFEPSAGGNREFELFLSASDLPPEERGVHLDEACGDDARLRRDVEDLLRKAGEGAAEFLETVPFAGDRKLPVETAGLERAGSTIGRYRLLREVGEGGFGVVYEAEQREPVNRLVALKIIKPGMDSREVISRFEVERQALALMEHPNIARVLDAGATESGRPYFVMELVKGEPMTTYCDSHRLSLNKRLGLFIDVCAAVQHAHQKGVIHRDLKPSNILVSEQDDSRVVKVIDFGVAKALGRELTEKTLFTQQGQMIGTPQYMSPEQAEPGGIDIDTRSDIYSLGVLLYELLTGRTPIDPATLREAGYQGVQKVLHEVQPLRPSAQVSHLEGDAGAAIADAREELPEKMARSLRGDLDWIVMRALENERDRRYDSANGLALDVAHFLAHEPVAAGPPSLRYRFGKFARRNRPVVSGNSITGGGVYAQPVGAPGTKCFRTLLRPGISPYLRNGRIQIDSGVAGGLDGP